MKYCNGKPQNIHENGRNAAKTQKYKIGFIIETLLKQVATELYLIVRCYCTE